MDVENFDASSPGRLVTGVDGLPAFVPDALPPMTNLSPATFKLACEVSTALGRLDGIASTLPDPTLLVRSFVRREAQISSYIENTYANYDAVSDAEQEAALDLPAPVRETVNAESAIRAGIAAVRDQGRPVTIGLIRELHSILLKGVRGDEGRGRYRTQQVYIGDERLGREHARFVPPPPYFLNDLMEDHAGYLASDDGMPWPIRLALLHYHFETIHPFEDGNGRLGRLLILLGLCQHGLLTVPVLNPSLYLERHRRAYYDGLLDVSQRGRWLAWIEFFLEALRVAAVESAEKVNEVLRLQADYRRRLDESRTLLTVLHFVESLLVEPTITVKRAATLTGLSDRSTRDNLAKLVDVGILEQLGGRPTRFRATEILRVLNPVPTRN